MSRTSWQKLKDSKTAHWAVGYAAVAWLILQILGELDDTFDWPAELVRLVTYLLASGIIPVLIIAWYHGDRGKQRATLTEMIGLGAYVTIVALASWRYLDDVRTASDRIDLDAFLIEVVSVDPPVDTILTREHFEPHFDVAVTIEYSFDNDLADIPPNMNLMLLLGAVYDDSGDSFRMKYSETTSVSEYPTRSILRGRFEESMVQNNFLTLQVTAAKEMEIGATRIIGAPVRIEFLVEDLEPRTETRR